MNADGFPLRCCGREPIASQAKRGRKRRPQRSGRPPRGRRPAPPHSQTVAVSNQAQAGGQEATKPAAARTGEARPPRSPATPPQPAARPRKPARPVPKPKLSKAALEGAAPYVLLASSRPISKHSNRVRPLRHQSTRRRTDPYSRPRRCPERRAGDVSAHAPRSPGRRE